MRRAFLYAVIALIPGAVKCDDTPVKVTVRELLARPEQYDGRRVDVTGYYRCDHTHASELWTDAATGKRHLDSDPFVFIDPASWDPQLHPKQSKTMDPWRVTRNRARIIGTFRSRLVPPGVASTGGSGPSITDLSYFRRVR